MSDRTDVVVIGAGIVGAACAYFAARRGLSVVVLDRGPIVAGTTGAGEGNILLSDKEPGPELELALLSSRLWRELGSAPLGASTLADAVELETKGGLVVAATEEAQRGLERLVGGQRTAGIDAEPVSRGELPDYEPHLAADLAGGCFYPQDMQVQPMLAAASLLRLATRSGAVVRPHEAVTEFLRRGERVIGVRTQRRDITAAAVVNASGTWAGEVARLAGLHLPVAPRRGFILVTEPLPRVIRHKVYFADYVADVASDSALLQTSAVIEGTHSGPVLIGASRERVGFDPTFSLDVLRRLAAGAVRLFPVLGDVAVLRAYRGFRPYCPDHLPVIGPDSRAPGLLHACGHEGAGIGLSLGTGSLIAQTLTGSAPDLDLTPFRPERFTSEVPA
jgi:D-hydroxyproline dehydrogenase subunit beta